MEWASIHTTLRGQEVAGGRGVPGGGSAVLTSCLLGSALTIRFVHETLCRLNVSLQRASVTHRML